MVGEGRHKTTARAATESPLPRQLLLPIPVASPANVTDIAALWATSYVKGGGKTYHWVLKSSENDLADWPAEMSNSHHGECDFDSKRTGKTSGSEQFAG